MSDITVKVADLIVVQAKVADTIVIQPKVAQALVANVRVAGGLAGPPGPAAGFAFTQVSPADEWIINHNLGYRPSVELFTTGGVKMEAAVLHVSFNQVLVQFSSPQAGSARLV